MLVLERQKSLDAFQRRFFPGNMRKRAAAPDGSSDSNFENSFSTIADGFIRDRSPGLVPYRVGFQLLERNEEGNKAVGITGFNAGKLWLYVPTFFLNGQVKGTEMLYIRNRNKMVPNKDGWVNYLINRQPVELGSSIQRSNYRRGVMQPDLNAFRFPPSMGKYSSLRPEMVPGIAWYANMLEAGAPEPSTFDLVTFCKSAGAHFSRRVLNAVKVSPDFASAMNRFYPGRIAELEQHTKQAISFVTAPRLKTPTNGVLPIEKKAAAPDVQFLSRGGPAENLVGLSDEQRSQLFSDEQLCLDRRSDAQVSRIFSTKCATAPETVNQQVPGFFATPQGPGLYDVLVRAGSTARCAILTPTLANGGGTGLCVVKKVDGDGAIQLVHPSQVYVRGETNTITQDGKSPFDEFQKWFDQLSSADSGLSKGSTYVLVGADGSCTAPFEVMASHGADTEGTSSCCDVSFHDRPDLRRPVDFTAHSDNRYPRGIRDIYSRIRVTDFTSGMNLVNGELLVSSKYKKIEVTPAKRVDVSFSPDASVGGNWQNTNRDVWIGSPADFWMQLMAKESSLQMRFIDGRYTIARGNEDIGLAPKLTAKEAAAVLVCRHGLRKEAADATLEETSIHRQRLFVVKYAQPYPMQEMAPSAPSFPDPEYGSEYPGVMSNPAMTSYQANDVPGADQPRQEMEFPSPDVMQMAQQASNTGQKDVFDAGALSMLLNNTSADIMIDEHVRPIEDAVDRFGKLLFSFYAHNEEFADRFGKQDLPELEMMLRNAFERCGDAGLYLKQKSVQTLDDESSVGIDPSMAARD